MSKLRARQLFTNDHPEQANSKPYVKALIILQAKAQVYYSMLANTDVIWTDAIATGATDGVYVYLNKDFFRGLASDSQRAFLLAHEVAHIVLRHPQRGKAFMDRGYFRQVGVKTIHYCPQLWNRSADPVINADLIEHGLEFIPDGLLDADIDRNQLVDDVYMQLVKKQDEQPKQKPTQENNDDSDDDNKDGGKGNSQGDNSSTTSGNRSSNDTDDQDQNETDQDHTDEDSDKGGDSDMSNDPMEDSTTEGIDTHLVPQYDGTEDEQEAAQREDTDRIADAVDQAIDQVQASRDRGEHNQPEIADGLMGASRRNGGTASATDWRAELADRVTRVSAGQESTWSRINRRRYINTGVIAPSRVGSFDRVVTTMDTSYSVQQYADRVESFMTEAASLIDTLAPASGATLVQCGHYVTQVDEVMSGDEFLDINIVEGGGTYMASSVEWLEENGIEHDIHLIFTDGEMGADDYRICAESGAILVLVVMPDHYYRQNLIASGIDYILANDDPLAA
jgi:predicted metal-dependent peptidase